MKNLSGGMVKSLSRNQQPEGTVRDALNANLNLQRGSVTNEYGTYFVTDSEDFRVLGSVTLEDDRLVVFGKDIATDGTTTSSIRLINDKNSEVLRLLETADLNFQDSHPIVATYRKNQAGEVLVYFTDGYRKVEEVEGMIDATYVSEANPPRVINVTAQEEWVRSGGAVTNPYSFTNSIDKLSLIPPVGVHAMINSAEITTGGTIRTGSYHLGLAYRDYTGLETNYFVLSNPVYISDGHENTLPTSSFIGAQGGTATNKAIKWEVQFPEKPNYDLLQPVVVRRINDSEVVYKLTPIKIPNSAASVDVTFTGLEDTTKANIDDIIIDDIYYSSATTLTQSDNRLYLGNVTTSKDIGYQPFALNIQIDPVVEQVDAFDPRIYDTYSLNKGFASIVQKFNKKIGQDYIIEHENVQGTDGWQPVSGAVSSSYEQLLKQFMMDGNGESLKGYKSPKYSFKKKSYRRSEVYAFYVSFVLDDGTETYAYHIPGRDKSGIDLTDPGTGGVITSEIINEASNLNALGPQEMRPLIGFAPKEILHDNKNAKVYQLVDTHRLTLTASNDMSFWRNETERYPATQDFIPADVDGQGNVLQSPDVNMWNVKVRHHKMPSNFDPAFAYIQPRTPGGSYISESAVNESGAAINSADGLGSSGMLVTNEDIRLLGIKLKNIKIPKHLFEKVIGYKVYYAKRKPDDRTILGQSIAVPGHPRYASVAEQSLLLASKGPYNKAFYMYGGLDHTDDSSIQTVGEWKKAGHKDYFAHPVFKFHDFNMLRNKSSLAAATHVHCQYGVIFRNYSGGPGTFVRPVSYDKLYDAPGSDTTRDDQLSTVLPSLGWVSPQLMNTVDFYYRDPLWDDGASDAGHNHVLDISDEVEVEQPDSSNRRSKKRRDSEDFYQGEGGGDMTVVDKEARKRRTRGWWTSIFVGTSYISPATVLGNRSIIKAGDNNGTAGNPYDNLNRWYQEGDQDAGGLIFALEAGGATYLPGMSLYENKNSSAFKGVRYLYNMYGESCAAFSMISGLPALRGHAPALPNPTGGNRFGLTRWGEGLNYCFPDAAADKETNGVPLTYLKYGSGTGASSFLDNGSDYEGTDFRGLNYELSPVNQFYGHPMAWLTNVCAIRTDVFQPFDKQELVWTGHYQPILNKDVSTGYAEDEKGNPQNYYIGQDSEDIFGGDTYITKYSFRTTSMSYGSSFFRANMNDPQSANLELEDDDANDLFDQDIAGSTPRANRRRQADIPASLNPLKPTSFGTTRTFPVWNSRAANIVSDTSYSDQLTVRLDQLDMLRDTSNWVAGTVNPVATIMTFIVESDDLIGFRHVKDTEAGIETKYFDYNSGRSALFDTPDKDYTKQDNLLYSDHYSFAQDIKVTTPVPVWDDLSTVDQYPQRVARSTVDSGSLADGYRRFRALDFKDVPAHRGEVKALFTYQNLLHIHTDRAMFVTKGKEELQLSAVTAFVGSGDIFTQNPDEAIEAEVGYGGTSSRHCHVTTRFGHFYLNYRDRKIFVKGPEGFGDINGGMSTWLRDNLPFALEYYGIELDSPASEAAGFYVDSPTNATPIGFTMGYDPLFERILITKHEPVPTQQFVDDWEAGNIQIIDNLPHLISECTEPPPPADDPKDPPRREFQKDGAVPQCGPIWYGNPTYFKQSGWTISYYPEMKVWGSRHSYRPNLYGHSSEYMYSFAEGELIRGEGATFDAYCTWKHSNKENPGRFYGKLYNFEIEYIDNTAPAEAKLFSNVFYWAESLKGDTVNKTESYRVSNTVFDSFYVYNSTQISGNVDINYLNNARLIDRVWYLNDFRDLSVTEILTEGNLISGQNNVAGYITSSVTTHTQSETMFTEEGVINSNYVDTGKEWYHRKKFIDHYMGVRLISDNSNKNLVHLYAAGTKFRKSYR